ncbi:MAG: glycosyltransferase family 4 protein [Vicinamibacteria bacterium]
MRVLMLLDNPATNDGRVQRESEALAQNGHDVTLVCLRSDKSPDSEIRNGVRVERTIDGRRLFDIKDRSYAKQLAATLNTHPIPDVLHTHDREMLHVATELLKLQPQVSFVHDIHEVHFSYPVVVHGRSPLLHFKSWLVHRLRIAREARDMRIVDRFITVNDSVEVLLRNRFRLPRKGVVVRNVPSFVPLPARRRFLHEELGIPADKKILVFIGANVSARVLNLEQAVREVAELTDVAFVFVCADNANKRQFQAAIEQMGMKNCFFRGLVPPSDIPRYLAACDAGIVPTWNKKNLSYWYALDNKLFDYVMAGIPVLATRQPEYLKIVESYGVGVCVDPDTPGAYRDGLETILGNPTAYQVAIEKARTDLNWDNESRKLLDLYKELSIALRVPAKCH